MTRLRVRATKSRQQLSQTYVIRIVVSVNNAVPTTHLIQMQVAETIEVRVAKWQEQWAVRKADWKATKGEISTG